MSLAEFAEHLGRAKRASRWSYKALGAALDRPPSTLHGWISGEHLPYPRDIDDFARLLDVLGIEDVDRMLAAVVLLRTQRHSPRRNPYRGLEAYSADDADLFFGRDDDAASIAQVVSERLAVSEASPPLVVLGRSGVGKSSLLQAGVQALLETDGHDVDYVVAADMPLPSLGDGPRVVIVDQFEFLLQRGQEAALAATIGQLHEAIDVGAVVVVVIRSDYFERASSIGFLMAGFRAGPYVVDALSPEQVVSCIIAPADRTGRTIEPALLTQLLVDVQVHAAQRVESSPLPLLSHILYRLASDDSDQLTLDGYRAIGGLEGALEQSAEDAFAELEGELPGLTRAVLCRMVELGEEGRPTRRPVRLQPLRASLSASDVDAVIDAFTRRRLVVVDIDSATISHETLVMSWPRLGRWIEETRASLATLRTVRTARSLWSDADRDPSLLLSGQPLDDAMAVTADPIAQLHLEPADEEFLAISCERRDAQRTDDDAATSRHIATAAALLAESERATSAQLAAAAYTISPTVEARSALISAAASALGPRIATAPGNTGLARFDRGLVHATRNSLTLYRRSPLGLQVQTTLTPHLDGDVAAFDISSDGKIVVAGTETGHVVILGTDPDQPAIVELSTTDRPADERHEVTAIAVAGKGQIIAVGHGSGAVTIWRREGDTHDWVLSDTIALPARTMDLAIDDGALRLATASYDGTVALWNLEGMANPLWTNDDARGDPASAIALDAAGSRLAAGHHGGEVRCWDLTDPDRPVEFDRSGSRAATWINSISFAPDGNLVAVASSDGRVRFWQVAGWQALERRLRHPSVITDVVLFDSFGLATTGEDGVLRVWLDHQAQPLDVPPTWAILADRNPEFVVSVDRTGAYAWTLDHNGELRTDDLFRPAAEGLILAGSGALSAGGSALCLGTRTGSIVCIDPASRQVRGTLDDAGDLIEQLAMDDAGTMLAAAVRDGVCTVWTKAADRSMSVVGTVSITAPALGVAIDPAGRRVAVTSGAGEIALAEVDDSLGLEVIARHRPTTSTGTLCATFHPTSALLATGSVDRTVTVWRADRSGLHVVRQLRGPAGNVLGVRFSPSGRRLAAGTTDGSIWLWQCHDDRFELETVITTGTAGVYCVVFAHDDLLFTAGPANRPQRWTLDPTVILNDLAERAGDPIDPELLRRYAPRGDLERVAWRRSKSSELTGDRC
ncbi:MAG: WD40 repeat domain-containing protein [Acidimicrobiales bacterium]